MDAASSLARCGPATTGQRQALDRLYALADAFVTREVTPCAQADWIEELQNRGASYDGDPEVCIARPLTLDQVSAALPPADVLASIRLEDVCTGSVLAAIQDPSLARLPVHEVPLPLPRASLSFAEGEDTRIVQHLASIGLLEVIDESFIWERQGSLLLSGLFGAEKRGEVVSAEDERTKLRLICNLKPSNACQRMIAGDLELLPCATQ